MVREISQKVYYYFGSGDEAEKIRALCRDVCRSTFHPLASS
jgi:hypothetical protein